MSSEGRREFLHSLEVSPQKGVCRQQSADKGEGFPPQNLKRVEAQIRVNGNENCRDNRRPLIGRSGQVGSCRQQQAPSINAGLRMAAASVTNRSQYEERSRPPSEPEPEQTTARIGIR